LIINNKLYGVLKSARTFGNFAYNGENNIIIDEPDIKEYDINDEDKYIFIANETFVDILKNENVGELIKRREEAGDISLEGIIEGILDKKISNYFFNNDIESGFDNITCTLIKLKNK
jgi:serine/threonine protein phosphatase PrpC